MNIKKYTIFGFFGLLFTLLLGIFIFKDLNNNLGNGNIIKNTINSKSILKYVPSDFEKIVYLRSTDQLYDFLKLGNQTNLTQEMFDYMKHTNELVVYQNFSGTEIVNLVFMNIKDTFDINSFKSSSFFDTGLNYDFVNIEGNNYLYGDKTQIGKIDFNSIILDSKLLKNHLKEILNLEYNLLLINNFEKNSNLSNYNEIFSKYIGNLKYSLIMSNISKNNFNGLISVIFDEKISLFNNYNFENKFTKLMNFDDLFYIEIGNIINLIGINKSEIINQMQLLFENKFNNFFTQADFNNIVNIFDGNIGLVIKDENTPVGISGFFVFENNGLFDLVKKFEPYIKQYIETTLNSNVYIETTNETFGFNFSNLFDGNIINGKVELKNMNNLLFLSFLSPNIPNMSGTSKINFDFDSKSIFHFVLNIGKILDKVVLKNIIDGNENNQVLDYFKNFKNKLIYGKFSINGNEIIFNYHTK